MGVQQARNIERISVDRDRPSLSIRDALRDSQSERAGGNMAKQDMIPESV